MPSVESWSCAFGTSKLHHNNRTTAQMEVYRLQDIFGLFEHKIHEQRYFASRRLPRPKLLYSAFFNRSFFSIWNDIKDIQPPYVMKPATSSGSHGTKLVRTYGEAKEALRKVYARDPLFDDWHLKDQLGGVLLVEQVRGFEMFATVVFGSVCSVLTHHIPLDTSSYTGFFEVDSFTDTMNPSIRDLSTTSANVLGRPKPGGLSGAPPSSSSWARGSYSFSWPRPSLPLPRIGQGAEHGRRVQQVVDPSKFIARAASEPEKRAVIAALPIVQRLARRIAREWGATWFRLDAFVLLDGQVLINEMTFPGHRPVAPSCLDEFNKRLLNNQLAAKCTRIQPTF